MKVDLKVMGHFAATARVSILALVLSAAASSGCGKDGGSKEVVAKAVAKDFQDNDAKTKALGKNTGGKQERFSVPGLFAIAAPGNEFQWQTESTKVIGDTNFYYFSCTKAGSTTRMALVVDDRNPDREVIKSAAVKANWNVLAKFAMQYKSDTTMPPALESPIANEVYYGGSFFAEDGSRAWFGAATVFKSRIYQFQVFSENREEVDLLIGVANSITELKK